MKHSTREAAERRLNRPEASMYGDDGVNPFASLPEETQQALITHGQDALTNVDNLVIGGMQFTQTGLVPVEGLTEEGLQLVGDVLYRFKGSFQWLMGDWLNSAGIYEWAVVERVAIHFRLSPRTLQNWKSISSSVPHSLRSEKLDYNHHVLVAPMPEDKQRYWLERAAYGDETPGNTDVRKRWSVARLRKEITGGKKKSGRTGLLNRAEKHIGLMMERWNKPTVTPEERGSIAAYLRKCADKLEKE